MTKCFLVVVFSFSLFSSADTRRIYLVPRPSHVLLLLSHVLLLLSRFSVLYTLGYSFPSPAFANDVVSSVPALQTSPLRAVYFQTLKVGSAGDDSAHSGCNEAVRYCVSLGNNMNSVLMRV